MNRQGVTLHARAGDLVVFDGIGVEIRCAFNDPEHGETPYVTISTEYLPAYARYDDATGLVATSEPFRVVDESDGACAVMDQDNVVVSRHFAGSLDGARMAAVRDAAARNARFTEMSGMPILAVDLNGSTIYDDAGDGRGWMMTGEVDGAPEQKVSHDRACAAVMALNEITARVPHPGISTSKILDIIRAAGWEVG